MARLFPDALFSTGSTSDGLPLLPLPGASHPTIEPNSKPTFGEPAVTTLEVVASHPTIEPNSKPTFGGMAVTTPILETPGVIEIKPYSFTSFGGQPVTTPQVSGISGPPALAPQAYDLRDFGLVTSVKDQGNCGSCWAFGTYASLESSILKASGRTEDFSENHLKNYHGFDWGPCSGGNDLISTAYLSRGSGPVDEKDDPYHPYDDRPSPGGIPRYYVKDSLWFDTDIEIKAAVMNYGVLTTYMFYDGNYFNDATETYYYAGGQATNHCVAVVGWDDNKVVPGAPSKGAWLIKNSWGTGFADKGYFWISYADSKGAKDAVSFTKASIPYSRVYYHDTYGIVNSVNCSYAFNAFTAQKNERLSAVGFYSLADSANYEIKVYDDYVNGQLVNQLASASGVATFMGYHTVNLPSNVSLKANDNFYVYLHLTNGGSYPLAIDNRLNGYTSKSTAKPGESFYSFTGANWRDLTSFDPTANFSIKALVESGSTVSISKTSDGKENGATNTEFTLTRSGDLSLPLNVNYVLSGSATAGVDYIGKTTGTATFNANASTTIIALPTINDTVVDPSESIVATIQAPTGYTISGSASATAIISDDDKGSLSIKKTTDGKETGPVNTLFTLTRTGILSAPLSVNYTLSGTAAIGSDYTGTSPGVAFFSANTATTTISLPTINDDVVDPNETIIATISLPQGYTLNGSGSATATILDNDPAKLTITPQSASKAEGNSGFTPFTFRVSRTGDIARVSSALWTVAGVGANAANGADFSGGLFPTGTVSFAAGVTSKTLTVNVAGDRGVEANETFSITLSDPSTGTSLDGATATGIISNDDTALSIAPLSSIKGEGRTGSTPFTFTVSRTGVLTGSSTVRWSLAGTGANPASGPDFTEPTSGTLTFAANQASRILTVAVTGDISQEVDETFSVTLSAPTGATVSGASAGGTILNDDLIGDATANTLNGTALAEFIDGRANVDTLTGAGAADVFGFRFTQSPLSAPDLITDFAFGTDKIDLFSFRGVALPAPSKFTRAATNSTASSLSALTTALFADANGALAGNQPLGASSAVLVQATNAAIAGTYLLINNSTPGRSIPDDLLVNLSGFTGTLPSLGVIDPARVFV